MFRIREKHTLSLLSASLMGIVVNINNITAKNYKGSQYATNDLGHPSIIELLTQTI